MIFFEEYYEYGQQIKAMAWRILLLFLNDTLDNGKHLFTSLKGAQGVMLDIDRGLSFVTSSNPVAGGVTIGSGRVGQARLTRL